MHELSIAQSIVTTVQEQAQASGAARVLSVTLEIGALSAVHEDALRFGFDLVTEGTILGGATLIIQRVPVTIFCGLCQELVDLPGIQQFRCPQCQRPSADIRRGQELDIIAIGIEEP